MDIFKAYESTMANVQPGQKHLRRDQLLDNYEAAASTLQTLIRARESEIAHRKDLIKMLEESKSFHDSRLQEAKQEYQLAKGHIPESVDLKSINVKFELSTTPPLPPPPSDRPPVSRLMSTTPPLPPGPAPTFTMPLAAPATLTKSSELDLNLSNDNNYQNRSSLDRRLSEFMKTFPNLTQAGVASANSAEPVKQPAPGYYTPQPPLPPMSTAPPSIDLLRFPPPNMVPPLHGLPIQPPPLPPPQAPMMHHPQLNQHQENHDLADMDMSDNEEGGGGGGGGVLPMIASAMQQGAGGKTQAQSFAVGQPQQFNSNPMAYPQRVNALPFDPSIMDPGLGGSSPTSSGSRDRYSGDKNSHRYSGGSSGSGSKHRSSSKKYSSSSSSTSSHSSSRGKTRH